MSSLRAVLSITAMTCAFAPTAQAQDEGGGFSFDFNLNSVLVATFESDQAFLEPEAERVRGLVETALGDAYVVVNMSEVPPFTDYSADIYLRSCPDGQYIGCVFVVGGRAETDWTIGGRVGAVEGGYQVDLSFIDVSDAKLVLEFDVVLDGSNDAEFQEGVQRIMDALVNGEVKELDLRGDPEAQRAADKEAAERVKQAREFAGESVYEDFEDVGRGDVGLDAYVGDDDIKTSGRKDRVSFEDLEQMDEAGGLAPWERAGLTKSQYKLYRNSGKKLREFKARLQGRKGEILIKLAGWVNSGANGQFHDTFYVLPAGANANELRPAQIPAQISLQMQESALAFGGVFEFGYGVLPWMEIDVFGGVRSAPYRYRFYKEVPGEVPRLEDPAVAAATTFNVGAKLGFVPLPAYPVRPSIHIGGSYWFGSSLQGFVPNIPTSLLAAEFRPNNMVYVHLEPGLEVSAGKVVTIFARFNVDIPVLGRNFQRVSAGDLKQLSQLPPIQESFNGVGLGGTVGVAFRIRVAGLR